MTRNPFRRIYSIGKMAGRPTARTGPGATGP